VSRTIFQRLAIVLVSILAGTLLLAGSLRLLLTAPELQGLIILCVACLLISGSVGAWIGSSWVKRSNSPGKPYPEKKLLGEQQNLEAELDRLNQDLFSQAQQQAAELSRLNLELQLQMAMVKQAVADAQSNEERFRTMADNVQEGLTIIENDKLVYMNDQACRIYGDCLEGNLYQHIQKYSAPEERVRLSQALQSARQTGHLPEELEYWIVRKDGVRRCICERYSQLTTGGITRIFMVTSDITDSVQILQNLETAVNDRTRELSTVLDVSYRIASTLELEPLLNLVIEQIQTILPYSGAAIFTIEEQALRVATFQVPGLEPPEQTLYLPLDEAGPYKQVVSEQKVLIFDDIEGDTPLLRAYRASSELWKNTSFKHARSWIGIPLVARDQVIGLLSLTNSMPGYYKQQHAHLALTIANQVAVAIDNAHLYEKAQTLAALEERHRIARELHDSVTQLLYGITLYCAATIRLLRAGNQELVEENLGEIKENALQALQEMRLLILELNPPMLQQDGLVAALRSSLETIETRTGLETELKADLAQRLPRSTETELYRIAIEALNNLVRYARAKKVAINLYLSDGWVFMEISDNGVGFDPEQARSNGGMGLHNMEQRARQLGGWLEILTRPGMGTLVKVVAKVDGKRAQAALAAQVEGDQHGRSYSGIDRR
jgi:PAS domain S-box-containing protein